MEKSLIGLSLDENYLIAAAIDFGTTCSGYAFSFKNKPSEIKMNKLWGAGMNCESYKAPTCVMTNPDGSFHSFGYEAEDEYSQLDPDEDVIGGPNGYNIYRNFKMMLLGKGVTMSSTVVSTSGHIQKALDIFVMVLVYLKEQMMDVINKSLKSTQNSSDVRWVLTVPAIWNDESKGFMREAVYKAGLISERNSTKLLIALEPEAASIFCRSIEVNNFALSESESTEDLAFCSGEKILIIDAGGGTVDITAHQILINGNVKEITMPSGGAWGGNKVDEQFVLLLEKVFGCDFINKFKVDRPQQWLQLMTSFEKSKKAFKLDGKYSIKVPMPFAFDKDFLKHTKSDIEEIAKKSREISVNNGFITVKHDRAKMLFSEPIDQIAKHVMKLLNEENLNGLNYLLLVGGFGECIMLQDACQSILPKGIKLLVPVEAQSAVIRGAVLFGHNPHNICSRIARFTYGLSTTATFIEGKHDPNKKITDKDGSLLCDDIFDILISKGESVENGETREKTFALSDSELDTTLKIFKADQPDVTYTDEPGVTELGSATLYNSGADIMQMRVTIGHTELLIEAKERDGKDEFPVKITVDFLGDK